MRAPLKADETLDSLFGGKISFIQSKNGYRISLDSALLAATVLEERGRWLDLGCGSGVIGFAMLKCGKAKEVVGLEIQHSLYDRTVRGIALNDLGGRYSVVLGDLRLQPPEIKEKRFDGIVCNPPYFEIGSGIINPNSEKALARHQLNATIEEIILFVSRLLTTRKRFWVIFPAAQLPKLLGSLVEHSLQPKSITFIHGTEGAPATHAIVLAVRDAQPKLAVTAPIIVHHKNGKMTKETSALIGKTKM